MPPSSTEFEAALRKGLGRAMILLRKAPEDQGYNAALMRACRFNQVYDRQCEEDRVVYLHRLIRCTGRVQVYRDELLRCLSEGTPDASGAGTEDDPFDTEQIFGILCLIAARDRGLDRAVLRDFLLGGDDGRIDCVEHFVGLEGVDGLLLCVRRFHPALVADSGDEAWRFRGWLDALIARDGAEAAAEAVRNARAGYPELDELLLLTGDENRSAQRVAEVPLDYASAKAALDLKRGFPRGWVRGASMAELAQAAEDLRTQYEDRGIWRYLQIFGIRDFPNSPRELFHFLDNPNGRIAGAALRALQRLNHPDVRALALGTISQGARPAVAVRLLVSNHQPGDLKAVEAMLQTLEPDDETWHALGMAVLDLMRHASVSERESRGLLLRLYENGPCSLCRSGFVEKLVEAGGILDWMAGEGQFDAEPATASTLKDIQSEGRTFFATRAAGGDRAAFRALLDGAGDEPPRDGDALP